MKRKLALVYGLFSYLLFMITFLYFIGFLGDLVVPKTIDSGSSRSLWPSLLINLGLLSIFAIQHSLMARSTFKKWWTRIVPQPIERSTYVLFSSLILWLIVLLWQPLPSMIWSVSSGWLRVLIWALFVLGWITVFISARMINESHLFGVQQVRRYAQGEESPSPEFQTPGLYRFLRHPLMLGFLIAFWATPDMTYGHMLFSIATTVYIVIGIQFEERSLIKQFGDRYKRYQQRVPMLFPQFSPYTVEQS